MARDNWAGALNNYESFLDRVGNGVEIVYQIDPDLGSRLREYIQTGQQFIGLAQQLAGGSDAGKGAAIQAIVNLVIAAYTKMLERMARISKAERDRLLSEARQTMFADLVDNPVNWPARTLTVPHISITISGGGIWIPGGKYQPAIFKPDRKEFRYLRPGPTKEPTGCAATVPSIGSVEGTNSEDCVGQIGIYSLLYPCWRERSLSTGGELLEASDVDDPGALLIDLQTRAVFEPEVNLIVPMGLLEQVVVGFETRFWQSVKARSKMRRGDPWGQIGPKPTDGWSGKSTATRDGELIGGKTSRKAGLCGMLNSPHSTKENEWANGIQILDSKPSDPTPDDRFYQDENGIIRAVWNDADLESCSVLSGSVYMYDPDTGDRGKCTIVARNAIWAAWLNISTARTFWAAQDYVREAWERGDFPVDPGAVSELKDTKPTRLSKADIPPRRIGASAAGGGGAVVALLAAGGLALALAKR